MNSRTLFEHEGDQRPRDPPGLADEPKRSLPWPGRRFRRFYNGFATWNTPSAAAAWCTGPLVDSRGRQCTFPVEMDFRFLRGERV